MEKSITSLLLLLLLSIFLPRSKVLSSTTGSDQDYYGTEIPSEEEHDYIIIGGGTAGCPLAATLSTNYSVLLLERGAAPSSYPNVLNLQNMIDSLMEEDNGENPVQRFTSEDGVGNVRGRILGGSSMINIGFYSRAHKEFYEKPGVEWDMGMVEKAYQWVEETVLLDSELKEWQSAFREALLEGGIGPDNGYNLNHVTGTKITGSIFDALGRRHGAVELLNKADSRNLKVVVQATVENIIFSSSTSNNSNVSATGVIYTDSKGKSHKVQVRNRGEIILSAGAIGSPQLLLHSGIGSKSYLSSLKIPLVLDQPYVGQFMADNPRNQVQFLFPFQVEPSNVRVVGTTRNNIHFETASLSFPLSFTTPFSLFSNRPSPSPVNLSMAFIALKFSNVLSHGSLQLVSPTDIRQNPIVRFNYYSNQEDLNLCVSGIRRIGDLLNTKSMERFKAQDLKGVRDFTFLGSSLPVNQSDDASMEEFCKRTVTSFWHYYGGCLVGKVVDGDLRVIGVNGLRVVDGSIFTVSPGTNPMATVMMLGRYIGLKMLQERVAE